MHALSKHTSFLFESLFDKVSGVLFFDSFFSMYPAELRFSSFLRVFLLSGFFFVFCFVDALLLFSAVLQSDFLGRTSITSAQSKVANVFQVCPAFEQKRFTVVWNSHAQPCLRNSVKRSSRLSIVRRDRSPPMSGDAHVRLVVLSKASGAERFRTYFRARGAVRVVRKVC